MNIIKSMYMYGQRLKSLENSEVPAQTPPFFKAVSGPELQWFLWHI